jgi:hypothetical protein
MKNCKDIMSLPALPFSDIFDGEVTICVDRSCNLPYHILYIKKNLEYEVCYKADTYEEAMSALEYVGGIK